MTPLILNISELCNNKAAMPQSSYLRQDIPYDIAPKLH